MALNTDLIEKFKKTTRYDLSTYLLYFSTFTNNYSRVVVDYLSGELSTVPQQGLDLLDILIKNSKTLEQIIQIHSRSLSSNSYWDLLELIEDIKSSLDTLKNTPKYARVSSKLAGLTSQQQVKVQLVQDQTIENLALVNLSSQDHNQDLYKIALENNLREEDYTTKGGTLLNVNNQSSNLVKISTVVDIIDKDSIKGKDLSRKIMWDNNDLKVLTPNDTFLQSCDILVSLEKFDNPEFPSYGLSKNIVIGQNINSVSYPILLKQLNQIFNTDDTIVSFTVSSINRSTDGVFLQLEIISRSSEIFEISKTFT